MNPAKLYVFTTINIITKLFDSLSSNYGKYVQLYTIVIINLNIWHCEFDIFASLNRITSIRSFLSNVFGF